ncbi:HNH endonuclease family protein [Lentzea sp. NPDC054927]
MSKVNRTIGVLVAAAALTFGFVSPALATPPNIPSTATALSELASLTVANEGSSTGYSRDLFPHWVTQSGTCNTREAVLKRDGTNVVTDSACAATSGRWFSPYDGATWTVASDVDIDHIVPLSEAWKSGAASWTTARRQSFANDMSGPQLIAVTDNVNQAKGDKDPAAWKPPLSSYYCTYAKMWVRTKKNWGLTLQSTEKTALNGMLATC